MTGHLIVIRDTTDTADAVRGVVEAAIAAHPALKRLGWRGLTTDELFADPGQLEETGPVWLFMDGGDPGVLFEIASLLQERHVPALLTRAGEREPAGAVYQDGIVICPADTPPAVAAAMLQALRSQLPVLRAMKTEMGLLRAHQGGLADQIGRIDEELRLAAQLQREFLPKSLASIGGVDFRVLFRPAGYVSGDIYDVIRLDEKHIGFFIADAVGHGVPAALLTMYIKRSLITKRIDPGNPRGYRITEPAEALSKLNHDMVEQQGGHVRFATACYGVINCETLGLCVARAGHPFPILLRANGETESLQPEGGLLGVFEEETYEQICVQLHEGDRLLLYSDGFEMAFPDPRERSSNGKPKAASTQYTREFEDLRHGAMDEALARLSEKLDTQIGSLNQRDDLTILCMDVRSAAQVQTDGGAQTKAA